MEKVQTKIYSLPSEKEPFSDWIESLDASMMGIVFERLNRVRGGNFGACKPITGYHGLYEIVVDIGPGYRIYYGVFEESRTSSCLTSFVGRRRKEKPKARYRNSISLLEQP